MVVKRKTAAEMAEALVRVEERETSCVCPVGGIHPGIPCPDGPETAEVMFGDVSMGTNLAEEADADCARIRAAVAAAITEAERDARRVALLEAARACKAEQERQWTNPQLGARDKGIATATAEMCEERIRSLPLEDPA